MVVGGLYTALLVPETKAVPIEAIEHQFRAHWMWGRIMGSTDDNCPTVDVVQLGKDSSRCK